MFFLFLSVVLKSYFSCLLISWHFFNCAFKVSAYSLFGERQKRLVEGSAVWPSPQLPPEGIPMTPRQRAAQKEKQEAWLSDLAVPRSPV
jgi:hypothetical protein